MSKYRYLSIEDRTPVRILTLRRPPVNALDGELLEELASMLVETVRNDSIAVLHIRSAERVFCAGADLRTMQASFAVPGGQDAMLGLVRRMQEVFASIEAAPTVTVAEIHGAAVGGGLELALACDLRVAATDAKLGLPEGRLGVIPGAGGTQRLTRMCGPAIAKRLILGAEIVTGTEAEQLGLVQWTAPTDELAEFAEHIVQRVAAIPRPALVANKTCIAAASDADRDGFAEEVAATRRLYGDVETQRRVNDFARNVA